MPAIKITTMPITKRTHTNIHTDDNVDENMDDNGDDLHKKRSRDYYRANVSTSAKMFLSFINAAAENCEYCLYVSALLF